MRPLENLLIHQMDVKTAYLHAPIDYDIYINPPEGYEETDDGLLYKLQKQVLNTQEKCAQIFYLELVSVSLH